MAIMYPSSGPKDTGSPKAEPTVYRILKEQLDDHFHIIHSIPWLCSITKEYYLDSKGIGEVDFLVLHPEWGGLAIEVKGGSVKHDHDGFYYQRSQSDGSDKERLALYEQANKGRFALQELLRANNLHLNIGLAFYFPGSEVQQNQLPPSFVDFRKPISLVFDKSDEANILNRIIEVMQYYQSCFQKREPLGEASVAKIVDCILPKADYGPCWISRIKEDEVQWLRLTDEQIEASNLAIQNNRLLLNGWPGSGKTIVGIESARLLEKRSEKVLFLTFNELLSKKIRYELEYSEGCHVFTFHQLCNVAESQIGANQLRNTYWYKVKAAQSLEMAIEQGFLNEYDTLIVDEAQALQETWWGALLIAFKHKRIIAMCDETQAFPYETPLKLVQLESILKTDRFTFSLSLRTPKRVCNQLKKLIPPSYSLVNPRELVDDTFTELAYKNISDTIRSLIDQFHRESVPPGQVTFLFEQKDLVSAYSWLQEQGFHCESIGRFRGLEVPIVVVVTYGEVSQSTLFCAYSRCTTRCIVLLDAESVSLGNFPVVEPETKVLADKLYSELCQEERIKWQIEHSGLTLIPIVIESLELYWCEEWKCYVLPDNNDNQVSRHLWVEYFIEYEAPVIVGWRKLTDDRLEAYFYRDENKKIHRYASLAFKVCDDCQNSTPHTVDQGKYHCITCLEICESARRHDFEESLKLWDDIVCRRIGITTDEKYTTPHSLFALASLKNKGLINHPSVINSILDSSSFGGSATALLIIRAANEVIKSLHSKHDTVQNNPAITVANETKKFKQWNRDFAELEANSCRGFVSSSMDRLTRHNLLVKSKTKGERLINTDHPLFKDLANGVVN